MFVLSLSLSLSLSLFFFFFFFLNALLLCLVGPVWNFDHRAGKRDLVSLQIVVLLHVYCRCQLVYFTVGVIAKLWYVIWHFFIIYIATSSSLREHVYSNIENILPQKTEKFQIKKNLIFFHISAQNIDYGYLLEPPR